MVRDNKYTLYILNDKVTLLYPFHHRNLNFELAQHMQRRHTTSTSSLTARSAALEFKVRITRIRHRGIAAQAAAILSNRASSSHSTITYVTVHAFEFSLVSVGYDWEYLYEYGDTAEACEQATCTESK